MNVQEIAYKLESYKNDFYESKKEQLNNVTDTGVYPYIYTKIIDEIKNVKIFILFSFISMFFLSLAALLSISNKMLGEVSTLPLLFISLLSIGFSFGLSIYLEKKYYKRFFVNIKKDKNQLTDFLTMVHQNELNDSLITDDIHELLKLELSDEEYLNLRERGLTYQNVNIIIIPKLTSLFKDERKQQFLNEKHNVSLTQKDINRINKCLTKPV